MKGGTEFAFWILLFGEIAVAWVIYEIGSLILKLRHARREIARLTVERDRYQAWLRYKSDSDCRVKT